MKHYKKIFFILGALVMLALLLSACQQEPDSLVWITWSGYELQEFWQGFADENPDVEVEFSYIGESADAYAKMLSGFEADLMHPCSQYWKLMVDEEYVQPIDTSKLSNFPSLSKSFTERGFFNGEQYWVPFDWGFEAILVRTDLVDEVPTSWADLWDPQYAGHLAIYDSGETMHIITALVLGYDPWTTTPEQDAAIMQKYLELVPNVLTYWDDQTTVDQLVASGDVWVAANAWNASYKEMLDQGVDVEYVFPEEGSLGFLCGLAIPSSSTNVDLAHEMIDAYISVESQVTFANMYGYGISNDDAVESLSSVTRDILGLDNPEAVGNLVLYAPITTEQRESWENDWSEAKASQ